MFLSQMLALSLFLFAACAASSIGKVEMDDQVVVIGAGYGRTGTDSLKLALEHLGLGPTHHMVEVMQSVSGGFEHVDSIAAAARLPPFSKERQDKLRFALTNHTVYHSTTDFPLCVFYRDLMEMYPRAKVVLTVRDSADAWVASASSTIVFVSRAWLGPWPLPGMYVMGRVNPLFRRLSAMHRAVMGSVFFHNGVYDPEYLKAQYLQHIANVTAVVPADRLLVFNVKEGWGPLVRFLGVPEPAVPFPNVNDRGEFLRRVIVLEILGWLHVIIPVALLAWLFLRIRRWLHAAPPTGGKKAN
eukprot:m.250831 g.250831  ORF g.250831 m.250831 type:complete len:300 (+) comp16903_c0_seq1:26-925(+)